MTEELHDRHEYLGHLITDLIQMSFQETVESFVMTDSATRFEMLLGHLTGIRSEIAAISSLDQIGAADPSVAGEGDAASAAPGASRRVSALAKGMRIEYWYNEEYNWIPATLVGCDKIVGEVIQWDVKFDSDGSVEKLKLNDDNKSRWRLLRTEGR
eukprot:FR741064.1.p2 GENE.FR741064.1~~FR741064.1.p2  ORF type:complete len:156 (+),score=20.71 FR741064.1:3-470(+)